MNMIIPCMISTALVIIIAVTFSIKVINESKSNK